MNLAVNLTADIEQFRQAFAAATTTAQETGRAIDAVGTNISRNVANLNRLNMDNFNRSLRQGQINLVQSTSAASHFAQSTDQLQARLSSLQTALGRATDPIVMQRLTREIAQTTVAMRTMADVANRGMSNVAGASNRAGSALTDVGRIAQDLPFGFIAIQNNLNPMLESFQRLQRETGSAGGALRAMASQLTGFGGLGFALSVVGSAYTMYLMHMQKVNKATREAKEENKEYADTLDTLNRGLLKGAQNAQNTLVHLNNIYRATQDTTLAMEDRNKAVDFLQKKYPAYFKNMSNEAILAGQAAAKYNELTTAIMAKAKASALEDELKESAKTLRMLEKREELNKKAQEVQQSADRTQQAINNKSKEALKFEQDKNNARMKGVNLLEQMANTEAYKVTKNSDGTETREIKNTNTLVSENVGIQAQKNAELLKQKVLTKGIYDIVKSEGIEALIGEDKLEKTGKKVISLKDILEQLQLSLKQNEQQIGATFSERNAGKISAYQSALDSLVANGITDGAAEADKFRLAILDLMTIANNDKINNVLNFEAPMRRANEQVTALKEAAKKTATEMALISQAAEKVFEEMNNPSGADKKAKNDFVLGFDTKRTTGDIALIKESMKSLSDAFDVGQAGGLEAFKEKYQGLVNELRKQEVADELSKMGNSFLTSGIGDIASEIGEAMFSGADIMQSASNALLGGFSKFLSGYGDLLIKYGAAAVLKGKLDLAALIPGGGIVAGAAAVAAGIALKLAAGALGSYASGSNKDTKDARKPTAFANGGIISGQTYAMMGEYNGVRNNPEVVAPLNKLKGMISDVSQGGAIPYDIVLEGEKLKIIFDRANRRLNRV